VHVIKTKAGISNNRSTLQCPNSHAENFLIAKLIIIIEDLIGDEEIALGAHLEEKTCDRFRLKTIVYDIILIV